MGENTHTELATALGTQLGPEVRARFLRIETVVELDDGAILWDGEVHVFELVGHPRTKLAFAWQMDDRNGVRRTHVVLALPPIATASDAVHQALRSGPTDDGR